MGRKPTSTPSSTTSAGRSWAGRSRPKREPQGTVDILVQAEKLLNPGQHPRVFMDSGVENKNAAVDAHCDELTLHRVFAKVLLIPRTP
jgi:hypothetical protein